MILDLDTVREIASDKDFAIASGEQREWRFTYNVGPETYGWSIEVEFLDKAGKMIDKWQEYYAVASEFFRVHQHSYQVATKYWPADPHIFYFNQSHYFAREPTGLGVELFDADVYIAGQVVYRINMANRKAQMAHNRRKGIANSFYVIGSFDSQIAYERVRQPWLLKGTTDTIDTTEASLMVRIASKNRNRSCSQRCSQHRRLTRAPLRSRPSATTRCWSFVWAKARQMAGQTKNAISRQLRYRGPSTELITTVGVRSRKDEHLATFWHVGKQQVTVDL